jgi:hypothetical protein
MIRIFDIDMPCLGEAYESIDSMLKRIREIIKATDDDPLELFYDEVKNIVTKRWNKMITPLHLLAYALHPKYYHSKILSLPGRTMPNKDSEVVQGYKTTLRKIYRDVGIAMEVREEFGAFVQSTGNFSDPLAMDDWGHMDPITWWGFHGGDSLQLSTLATILLSQVASSSSAERNWSTYGFIHSMK